MQSRSSFLEVMFWLLALLAVLLGIVVFKAARALGVDYWTAAEMLGWIGGGLALMLAARWYESHQLWSRPLFRLATVWPFAVLFMWKGVFPVIRVWSSEVPFVLDWDDSRFPPQLAWYGETWVFYVVGAVILAGGYLLNRHLDN